MLQTLAQLVMERNSVPRLGCVLTCCIQGEERKLEQTAHLLSEILEPGCAKVKGCVDGRAAVDVGDHGCPKITYWAKYV